MRVYFDACCLQRPLDDRSQPRVNLEAEAMLTILGLVENGDLELIASVALEFEVDRTPDSRRSESGVRSTSNSNASDAINSKSPFSTSPRIVNIASASRLTRGWERSSKGRCKQQASKYTRMR